MTADDAKTWIVDRYGQTAVERIGEWLRLMIGENDNQNLIAPSTMSDIWTRHVLDSAQLVRWGLEGVWMDIGTGGGFPGMVVALLRTDPIILVEPRRRRADFLAACVETLGLKHVHVASSKVEHVTEQAATISARAVKPMDKLFEMASRCAVPDTRWILPRGTVLPGELALLRQRWNKVFHVEQSLTDPRSSIVIADERRRR